MTLNGNNKILLASIMAALAALACIALLNWAARHPRWSHIVTPKVREYAIVGIVIYTLCGWVINSVGTFFGSL